MATEGLASVYGMAADGLKSASTHMIVGDGLASVSVDRTAANGSAPADEMAAHEMQ
jgi:hypothetical protein